MTDLTTLPIHALRTSELPDLGAVTDDTALVAEHAGSGTVLASAVRTYVATGFATTAALTAETDARTAADVAEAASRAAMVSAAMAPVVSAATLAAGRTAFGIVVPALTGTRLAKTGAYSVANTDKGVTLALGGAAFFTLSFPAASGFDANFMVLVINEDTARGKNIVLTSFNFILWPGQSMLVFNSNNVWQTSPSSVGGAGRGGLRWVLASAATFYVNNSIGDDAAHDGLAAGAGAFRTIQHACNVVRDQVDINGFGVIVQLDTTGVSYAEGVAVVGSVIGSTSFVIRGDPAAPGNVPWTGPGSGVACITGRDYGGVEVQGVTFGVVAAGGICVSAQQFGVVDVKDCIFGSCVGGVHMQAVQYGSVNVTGNYTIDGNASAHIQAIGLGRVSISGAAVAMPHTLEITYFAQIYFGSYLTSGGVTSVYSGAGSGAGTTGQQYLATTNATLDLAGTTFPGTVAGVTTTGAQVVP